MCHTVELDAWNGTGHGGAAPLSAWEGSKIPLSKNGNGDESRKALFGWHFRICEGVGILSPNLRFGKLLKSAT